VLAMKQMFYKIGYVFFLLSGQGTDSIDIELKNGFTWAINFFNLGNYYLKK